LEKISKQTDTQEKHINGLPKKDVKIIILIVISGNFLWKERTFDPFECIQSNLMILQKMYHWKMYKSLF